MTAPFPDSPYDGVVFFDTPEVPLAAVRLEGYPLAEMPHLMDGTFPEIFTTLEVAGATVCGPPLSLHSRIPTDTADLAVGVPLTTPLTAGFTLSSGFRVEAAACPAGPVAATSYLGGYDGLGDAWGRFMSDVAASGRTPRTTFFEVYVSNPAEVSDPATLRTDLIVYVD